MHVFVVRMRLSNSLHKDTFIPNTQTQNVLSLNVFHLPEPNETYALEDEKHSAFHPFEVDKTRTRNFWELSGKK